MHPLIPVLKANLAVLNAGGSFVVVDSATWRAMWKKSLELYEKSLERYGPPQDTG